MRLFSFVLPFALLALCFTASTATAGRSGYAFGAKTKATSFQKFKPNQRHLPLYRMNRLQVIRNTPRLLGKYIKGGIQRHSPYHSNPVINFVGKNVIGGSWGLAIGTFNIGNQLLRGPDKLIKHPLKKPLH